MAGQGVDIVAVVRAGEASVNGLVVSGPPPDAGPGDLAGSIAAVMLAFAGAFLDERAARDSTAWRIADLPGGADRIRATVAERFGLTAASAPHVPQASVVRPVGVNGAPASAPNGTLGGAIARPLIPTGALSWPPVGVIGGATVLLAPLGRLAAAQLDWLAGRVTGRPARISPWRSVVLPGQADPAATLREAAALGFGVDEASPWLRVTACAGRPGCASALADVQADAAAFSARWPGRLVHVSGCARHCGRPAATGIDVTATSEGYQVAGV